MVQTVRYCLRVIGFFARFVAVMLDCYAVVWLEKASRFCNLFFLSRFFLRFSGYFLVSNHFGRTFVLEFFNDLLFSPFLVSNVKASTVFLRLLRSLERLSVRKKSQNHLESKFRKVTKHYLDNFFLLVVEIFKFEKTTDLCLSCDS